MTTPGATQANISLTHANVAATVTIPLTANGIASLAETTKISAIQGAGDQAVAGNYQVEAVVTGVYGTLSPAGFYVQEEDADIDADPNTSEGIFVAMEDPTVKVGDKVRIVGVAQENGSSPSFNQAVIVEPAVEILSSGNPAPAFVTVSNADYSTTLPERFEGMRVQFASPLTISEVSRLAQYGELSLSMDGNIYVPTQMTILPAEPVLWVLPTRLRFKHMLRRILLKRLFWTTAQV